MKTLWSKNLVIDRAPAGLSAWLRHKGSFMLRLKKYGVDNAIIQVLKQSWLFPSLEDRQQLNVRPRQLVYARDVLIRSAGSIWMYARTLLPRTTLTGKQRQLAHLKDRPIGTVLFKDPGLKRSNFEMACLRPESAWYEQVARATRLETDELWGRRSLFLINHKPLLLTEIFFPAVGELKHVNR